MISLETDGESMEKIDLYNFEDPKCENSRYVLTSPRSLEACSRLNVKPVELLYKPLTEFQEELLPQDVPLRTIYNVFDEQEQIRQRKIKLCQEERSRISKSEIQELYAQGKDEQKGGYETKSSLQRQRTAWSAGMGHERVTKDELNVRAQELQDESTKLREELQSRKDTRPRKPVGKPQSAIRNARNQTRSCSAPATRVRSKSASEIFSQLPARDRKILEIMTTKREVERKRLEESAHTQQLWEDEKKRQEALRIVIENKRRKMLARENNLKNLEKFKVNMQKDGEEEEEELNGLSSGCKSTDREFQLSDKRDSLKKSQEFELGYQAHNQEDSKKHMSCVNKLALTKALERRETEALHQSLRRSLNNHGKRLAFEDRRRQREKDARKQEKGAMSLIESRHVQAEENLVDLMVTRSQQLIASRMEEERRLEKARQVQQRQEQDMQAWRKSLLKHHKKVEKKAEVAARASTDWKAERVRQERLAHKLGQQKNFDKLAKEHEKWKQSILSSLEEKDRKIVEMQHQKERIISKTRSVAKMSQMLRDRVRMKYEHDTFDRKVLDAELLAKLEKPPQRSVNAGS